MATSLLPARPNQVCMYVFMYVCRIPNVTSIYGRYTTGHPTEHPYMEDTPQNTQI